MTKVNELILEIFKYIKSEESRLHNLEKEQNNNSDIAHSLETEANSNYEKRLQYIKAVKEMRRYRAGVLAHHDYISDLQIRYMEMNNKLSVEE